MDTHLPVNKLGGSKTSLQIKLKELICNYFGSMNLDEIVHFVELPEDITAKTSVKYIEGYERLTGKKFKV